MYRFAAYLLEGRNLGGKRMREIVKEACSCDYDEEKYPAQSSFAYVSQNVRCCMICPTLPNIAQQRQQTQSSSGSSSCLSGSGRHSRW